MRKISPDYTDKACKPSNHNELSKMYSSHGFRVRTYRELVEKVAELCYWNKDYLVFFRGQTFDYKNKAGKSTFYPTIYRKDPLTENDRLYRFRKLREASSILQQKLMDLDIPGWKEVSRWEVIQWSLLQHYEVTHTPLIDVTQSLRVACSFAQYENDNDDAYIYVFGLPYLNSRIIHSSEHELLYVRLLGIAPSIALRPHYQEGYLVGTEGITTEYSDKTELDLNNRLIAKFIIPNNTLFWGDGFTVIPKEALYPNNDKMKDLCTGIRNNLEIRMTDTDVGQFLNQWNKIETMVQDYLKRKHGEYSSNIYTSMKRLSEKEPQLKSVLNDLNAWRKLRNQIVHDHDNAGINISKLDLNSFDDLVSKLEKTLH